MSDVNIVIKAINKAAPIFARIKDDAIKMVQGISGRQVTINTAAAKKSIAEVGKEADKAGGKLKDMANTPMGGLIANIGKVGKALAGLAVVGAIGGAINKIREWREEWMMALERVAEAEVEFQKKISDAMKGDLPARRKREEAEMEKGIAREPEIKQDRARLVFRQKQEMDAADEKIAALEKELEGQIAVSAAATAAKESLTGLEGSARVLSATMGKEIGETLETFSSGGVVGGGIAFEAGKGNGIAQQALETASIGIASPEAKKAVASIVESASRQRELAERGMVDTRPVLEKHERKEQERAREIAVKQEELAAAKRAKTELTRQQAAELEKQAIIEERAMRLDRIAELEQAVEGEIEEAQRFADIAEEWKEAAKPGGEMSPRVAWEVAAASNPLAVPEMRDLATQGANVRAKIIEARALQIQRESGVSRDEAFRQALAMGGTSSGPRSTAADRMVRVNEKGQETLLKTGIIMKKSEAEILALREKERLASEGKGPRLSRAEIIKLRNAMAAKEAEQQLKDAQKKQQELDMLRKQAGEAAKQTAINTRIIANLLIRNLTAR